MRRLVRYAILTFAFSAAVAQAGDADEILGLLDDFLANAGARSAHERFWADDLVYTSSRGTRTTKDAILASFGDAPADEEQAPVYSADEVELKWLGDTAVVAFRLVARPPGDGPTDYYYNTGTFVKRGGEWRVVAWQATMIPPEVAEGSE
jgi:ketosteroid isomerase-like protein